MGRKSVKVATLDSTFSLAIREQYDYICAGLPLQNKDKHKGCKHCGNHSLREGGAECSHHYPRYHSAGRWHPDNCVCLCHEFHSELDQSPQIIQARFMRAVLGETRFDMLMERFHGTRKYMPYDRWEMNQHYRAQRRYIERLRTKEAAWGWQPMVSWD